MGPIPSPLRGTREGYRNKMYVAWRTVFVASISHPFMHPGNIPLAQKRYQEPAWLQYRTRCSHSQCRLLRESCIITKCKNAVIETSREKHTGFSMYLPCGCFNSSFPNLCECDSFFFLNQVLDILTTVYVAVKLYAIIILDTQRGLL